MPHVRQHRAVWISCAALSAVVLIGAPAGAATTPADSTLSALLKRQTQAFSDAGQRNDKAEMSRYLAPDVVFTNETGEILKREDMTAGDAPASAPDPNKHIEVTDWVLHPQGNVATATFVDVLTQKVHGQTLVFRYQSTETWARRDGGWKIIASHTMVVPTEPPSIALAPADLESYVGTYQLDPEIQVRVTRGADDLRSSTNGAPATPLKAEVRDVLFTPGIPSGRRIFQRDAAGRVTGYIARRNGADLKFIKVS